MVREAQKTALSPNRASTTGKPTKTLFIKNTDSQAAVRSPWERGSSRAQTQPSTPAMAKRTNTAATTTAISPPVSRGCTPTTEERMVATMKTLATNRLVFWLKALSTHWALAAAKPTSMRRTSITIFSRATHPAMVYHTHFLCFLLFSTGIPPRGQALERDFGFYLTFPRGTATGNCPGHHTVISAPVPWRASG